MSDLPPDPTTWRIHKAYLDPSLFPPGNSCHGRAASSADRRVVVVVVVAGHHRRDTHTRWCRDGWQQRAYGQIRNSEFRDQRKRRG